MQENCHTCQHKRMVPGSNHVSCSKKNLLYSAEQHGIDNGWFNFPYDFDPAWLKICTGYLDKNFVFEEASSGTLFKKLLFQISVLKERAGRGKVSTQEQIATIALLEDVRACTELMLNAKRRIFGDLDELKEIVFQEDEIDQLAEDVFKEYRTLLIQATKDLTMI